MNKEFKWNSQGDFLSSIPEDGMVAEIMMPVKVMFEFSDKIVSDWDENNEPLEYTSGFIMKVLPDQSKVYNKSIYGAFRKLFSVYREK